ncbi:MAG: hypothetical protein KJO00_05890 [Bacteroidia bacterium]|nr:hypothetical protein [Bacteroidia bacterium]
MKQLSIKIFVLVIPLILGLFGIHQNPSNILNVDLISDQTVYHVGDAIRIEFKAVELESPSLICRSSYGTTVLLPSEKKESLEFILPDFLVKKAGTISWQLKDGQSSLKSGKLTIIADQEINSIEVYAGPPDIVAGGEDDAMIVTIPLDLYNNPVPDTSIVTLYGQIGNDTEIDTLRVSNGIAFKRIFSPELAGRSIYSVEGTNASSKEIILNINPGLPTDFTIDFNRPHNYADGNQITRVQTSIITDAFQNIIADGTLVEFRILTKSGNKMISQATTIDGIAIAPLLHPESNDSYLVEAVIPGLAKSNTVQLEYEQAVFDIPVTFHENTKEIVAGPILSFLGQWIPDGFRVKLKIYQNDTLIKTISEQTINGRTKFMLNDLDIPEGKYTIKIEAGGLIKELKTINL